MKQHSFPIYRQYDAMLCGVTCLQMLCKYHGLTLTQQQLAEYCPASAEGVSLLGLRNTARELGFDAECMMGPLDELIKQPLPALLHWEQNHFVVLYKYQNGIFYVADPAKGGMKYTAQQMQRGWLRTPTEGEEAAGIVMTVVKGSDFESRHQLGAFAHVANQADTHQAHRRSLGLLTSYFAKHKGPLLKVLLTLIACALIQLVLPFLTQAIVDKGIAFSDMHIIWLILIGQLVLTLSYALSSIYRRQVLLKVSLQVNIDIVGDFFAKLLRLPMAYFETKQMGDLLQRVDDHKRVESFLTSQLLTVSFSLLTFIIFAVVLAVYDLGVFAIFMGGSLLYAGWLTLFLDRRKQLDYALFEQQADNDSKTYQLLTSMQEIKLQNCSQRRLDEWRQVQTRLYGVKMNMLQLLQIRETGSTLINEIKNIAITVTAAYAVISGSMTLGMMLAVQYIIGHLNAPVQQLMACVYDLQDVRISLERINEIHNRNDEQQNHASLTTIEQPQEGIRLEHVSFKYVPHALRWTIDDLTVHIPQGKVTAIVGASGSGKTTLLKLLLGFYPVTQGSITIGATPLTQLNLDWWRKQCGVVMQEGVIFSESIARNIAAEDGEIDQNRLKSAIKLANIDEFADRLPHKYDTRIGIDGINLSLGQRQRILIARAIYRNPHFILLDEATNSLDANNEREINDQLSAFYQGRTVIVVAHRLSTVRHADQIIVLDNGKICECGTHEQLTDLRGAYYQLVKNQLELGQ